MKRRKTHHRMGDSEGLEVEIWKAREAQRGSSEGKHGGSHRLFPAGSHRKIASLQRFIDMNN